jgi:hypothetical protein
MKQHQPRGQYSCLGLAIPHGIGSIRNTQLTTNAVFTPLHHVRRIVVEFSRT